MPDPGFMGATSFSDVYAEGLHNLQPDHQDESVNDPAERLYLPNRESQVRRGMTCLSLLTSMPEFEALIQTWHSTSASTCTLITPFIGSVQKAIRHALYKDIAQVAEAEKEALLFQQSSQIWRNSLENMKIADNCTIAQYNAILSDRTCLRWVVLGLYFTALGLAAVYSKDSGSRNIFTKRRRLAKQLLEASDICISFCEEVGDMSDAETWLYSENAHLVSIVEGDASESTPNPKERHQTS